MPAPRRTQAQRRDETRAALLAAGRRLFAETGYDDVAAEQVVAEAGVTRGALYHHFEGGKAGLFEAVFVEIEEELVAQFPLDDFAADPLGTLRAGIGTFLDLSLGSGVQRITLIDGPAVLGWARWQQIEAEHGLGLIQAGLDAAVAAGQLPPLPTAELATALLGALIESALAVARADDVPAARARAEEVLVALLDGLASR